jgi:hypothetical protein
VAQCVVSSQAVPDNHRNLFILPLPLFVFVFVEAKSCIFDKLFQELRYFWLDFEEVL